jgi:peptide/nickel transport system substrate-binding protein
MLGTAAGALMLSAKGLAFAQDAGTVPDLNNFPRNETVIVHNPEGVIRNPGWFNLWANGGGGLSTGLQQLTADTFWYIDPDAGIPDASENAIYYSLAEGPWEYNDDFSEMTVRLRKGIMWSDGVEFTADDVVFTVEKQAATPGTGWYGAFSTQIESVTAEDPYTVHFVLKAPNSRFHTTFAVRWNAAWIMPKHVFEGVEDIVAFDNNPPVSLGPYTLHSYDPNGTWYIWEKRPDWDKTTMALVGEPKPKYVIYRNNISTDNRLIEMRNGNLDMIHDLSPEGNVLDRGARPRSPRLVPRLPLCSSRSDAADGGVQPAEPDVPGQARALGAHTHARCTGHVDGLLSRRGNPVGYLHSADRHASARLSCTDAGVPDQLRTRYRLARHQAV